MIMKNYQENNYINLKNGIDTSILTKISLPAIICRLPDFKIIYVNNSAEFLYGYSNEEFMQLYLSGLEAAPLGFSNPDFFEDSFLSGANSKIIQSHVSKTNEALKVEINLSKN